MVARRAGGASLLRIEDIDAPRIVAGAEQRIEEDLQWLGLDWDCVPVRQSERFALYEAAIERLRSVGLVYECDCSRAEIARAASAPHGSEDAVYPGACRHRDPARAMKRPPALRVRVPDVTVTYEDGVFGAVSQALGRDVGDFVVRRGDGVFAYQLAVVVDDLAMKVTDVVRGADLIPSTPRQIWLARTLGGEPPRYAHVPLVVTADDARLEKRTPASTIRELRAAGVAPERIVGVLAHGLGVAAHAAPKTAREVARASADCELRWSRASFRVPADW